MAANKILVPEKLLGKWMLGHESHSVRLSGFSFLVSSSSEKNALTMATFHCLENFLPQFFVDADASFRGSILGFLQNLIDRVRASLNHLARPWPKSPNERQSLAVLQRHYSTLRYSLNPSSTTLNDSDQVTEAQKNTALLEAHVYFLLWFWRFLIMELRVSCSYQRHFMALKAMLILFKSGIDSGVPETELAKPAKAGIHWPVHASLSSKSLERALLDLLLDPFDDIRLLSTSLLRLMHPETDFGAKNLDGLSTKRFAARSVSLTPLLPYLERAQARMLDSGRVDHADGVARVFSLLVPSSSPNYAISSSIQDLPKKYWWTISAGAIYDHLLTSAEESIARAKCDLSTAVGHYPLHGIFTSLRCVLIFNAMARADLLI